jgi:ABC-type multidrug transport system fused ATPase/permease subunit
MNHNELPTPVLRRDIENPAFRWRHSCTEKRNGARFAVGVTKKRMPVDHGKSLFFTLRWLARYLRPFVPLLIVDLICMTVASGLSLLDPLVVKWLIDTALPKRDLRLVLYGTLVFCAVYLASMGLNYLASFISCLLAQKMMFRIRLSSLRQLHTQPAQRYERAQVGDTLFRLEQDVERVAELSGDILPLTTQMALVGVMVLVTMGILNWHLTVLVAPVLPVFYFVQRHYSAKLKNAADQVQNESGRIHAFLQEHLAGLTQLHLLNRTGTQTKVVARLAANLAQLQVRQRSTEMFFGAASVSVIVAGMGLILGYGGYEVTRGALTVGGLVAFYGYVFRLFAPLGIAIDLQSRLQRAGASIRRIAEITDHRTQSGHRTGPPTLRSDIRAELEFQSVWFSFQENRTVLRDMSFRIEPGETVAIVGLNGSGKSTIGLLATRLYVPDAGSILVGGEDIAKAGCRSLRATITLVPQDPILFDKTVRGNLLFGNPRATDADLERVANLTKLDRVIQRLPRGWYESLGPSGTRLSGGEKKQLALARALLQQPRILILDEITSSLDAPSADTLLHALDHFRQGRTLIVVSHRPSTILWANRILVVDGGAIVGDGNHEDLSVGCVEYQEIWHSQDSVRPAQLCADRTEELGTEAEEAKSNSSVSTS